MALSINNIVKINFKGGIGGIQSLPDSEGNVYTLPETLYYYFGTSYYPLYATVVDVSIMGGAFVEDIPDETIALTIYKKSREVEAIAQCELFSYLIDTDDYFANAVNVYVTSKVILALLGAKASSILQDGGDRSKGKTKRLGDFEVSSTGYQPTRDLSGLDDILDRAVRNIELWERSVQSCGELRPGDHYAPNYGIKSADSGVLPPVGREWESGNIPAANSKVYSTRYQAVYTSSRSNV